MNEIDDLLEKVEDLTDKLRNLAEKEMQTAPQDSQYLAAASLFKSIGYLEKQRESVRDYNFVLKLERERHD